MMMGSVLQEDEKEVDEKEDEEIDVGMSVDEKDVDEKEVEEIDSSPGLVEEKEVEEDWFDEWLRHMAVS